MFFVLSKCAGRHTKYTGTHTFPTRYTGRHTNTQTQRHGDTVLMCGKRPKCVRETVAIYLIYSTYVTMWVYPYDVGISI